MAGMTSVSGLALAAFFWVFSTLTTLRPALQQPFLQAPPLPTLPVFFQPTDRQASSSNTQMEEAENRARAGREAQAVRMTDIPCQEEDSLAGKTQGG